MFRSSRDGRPHRKRDSDRVERRLAAILSADVAGYSRLMADDEDATVRTVTAYREQIELHVREDCSEVRAVSCCALVP